VLLYVSVLFVFFLRVSVDLCGCPPRGGGGGVSAGRRWRRGQPVPGPSKVLKRWDCNGQIPREARFRAKNKKTLKTRSGDVLGKPFGRRCVVLYFRVVCSFFPKNSRGLTRMSARGGRSLCREALATGTACAGPIKGAQICSNGWIVRGKSTERHDSEQKTRKL
jgi:hypothetical protein